jgi:hypothetical protein
MKHNEEAGPKKPTDEDEANQRRTKPNDDEDAIQKRTKPSDEADYKR